MKYEFNKIALQKLQRELAIRVRALPTLKAKETALRFEVTKSQDRVEVLQRDAEKIRHDNDEHTMLWAEYPGLLTIKEIQFAHRQVAGVRIEIIDTLKFDVLKAALFHQRGWVVRGTDILREMVRLKLESDLERKNTTVLQEARKRATRKVNLYEKIQIPRYAEAIRRIRTFLDDKENLSRAAQKIVKHRVGVGS